MSIRSNYNLIFDTQEHATRILIDGLLIDQDGVEIKLGFNETPSFLAKSKRCELFIDTESQCIPKSGKLLQMITADGSFISKILRVIYLKSCVVVEIEVVRA